MRKKLLSLALALVMCLVLTVPALAHDIQKGTTVWATTNEPVGTETVKVDKLEYPTPQPTGSSEIGGDISEALEPISASVASTPTGERDMQAFPAGTIITVKTPGYVVDEWTKEKHNNTTVYVQQYTLQSEFVTEYTTSVSSFSLALSDSNYYYILQIGMSGLDQAPVYDHELWFVKASNTGAAAPAPSTSSAPSTPSTPSTPVNNAGQTYTDEHIQVTNVTSTGKGQYTVDVEDHPEESWPEITCNAPVEITLDISKADLAQYAPAATYWDSERTDVTDGKITLTQPGVYVIDYFYGEGYYQCYYIVVKNGTAAPVGNTTNFTDVAADAYYAAPVTWALEKGITTGTSTTTFSPGQNCTNAQILTFLWRAYGQPEPTIGNPFTNSIPDAYTKAAVWAYEKGMVSGTAFDADKPCTRAMAVTYMWQAAGSPMSFASTDSFTDIPADASYALAVAWALERGITTGTSATTFSPDEICNRGQIVTFLHRNLA